MNNAGVTATISIYDGTSDEGTPIAKISSPSVGTLTYDWTLQNGLCVVLGGGTAPDVTVAVGATANGGI